MISWLKQNKSKSRKEKNIDESIGDLDVVVIEKADEEWEIVTRTESCDEKQEEKKLLESSQVESNERSDELKLPDGRKAQSLKKIERQLSRKELKRAQAKMADEERTASSELVEKLKQKAKVKQAVLAAIKNPNESMNNKPLTSIMATVNYEKPSWRNTRKGHWK